MWTNHGTNVLFGTNANPSLPPRQAFLSLAPTAGRSPRQAGAAAGAGALASETNRIEVRE